MSSKVYLLYRVGITLDAGLLVIVSTRKVLRRPSRHRFFLVSLCLKANAETVPNIPSCHYMLLM